eukprot:3403077-Amphidinium_carterae.1
MNQTIEDGCSSPPMESHHRTLHLKENVGRIKINLGVSAFIRTTSVYIGLLWELESRISSPHTFPSAMQLELYINCRCFSSLSDGSDQLPASGHAHFTT